MSVGTVTYDSFCFITFYLIRFPLSPTELGIHVALCNPLCYGVFLQGLLVSPTKLGTYVALYIKYKK